MFGIFILTFIVLQISIKSKIHMLLLSKDNLNWVSKWVSLTPKQIYMRIIFIRTKLVILLRTQMLEILCLFIAVCESNNKRNSFRIAMSKEDSKKMNFSMRVIQSHTLKGFMSFREMTWNLRSTPCGSLPYWIVWFNMFHLFDVFLIVFF